MKSMLMHSFVLDTLDTTGADTFTHFEVLIEEHRRMEAESSNRPSRLKQLVPTVGTFHTHLPLRRAFLAYNSKHRISTRRHVCISFNELRHILNLAQIMAMRKMNEVWENDLTTDHHITGWALPSISPALSGEQTDGQVEPSPTMVSSTSDIPEGGLFNGPKLITFDGDQTLYSDGANFESNPKLANYLYLLLKHGVSVAVVTAAGYEYEAAKYELRLSGLLDYFKHMELSEEDCERFYLFGGECNYLLQLDKDYNLHPVREEGPGGWLTSTRYLSESPGNWNEDEVMELLDVAENTVKATIDDLNLRARVVRKKRAIGLIPQPGQSLPREALDETVLRITEEAQRLYHGSGPNLPYCAFNGGRDVWLDVGNKRVGVQILQSYLGISSTETLHIGDQFLNTGNDFAARDVCPCVWITSPEETTYILKSILGLAGVSLELRGSRSSLDLTGEFSKLEENAATKPVDFSECARRDSAVKFMDVYTGEMIHSGSTKSPVKASEK
jgi:IMP and pyridine-specific 5'-nucleotidase